jgi:hypothetical protein
MLVLPETGRIAVPADFAQREALIRAIGLRVEDERIWRLVSADYVLVRNDGAEVWRCNRCNRKHAHYTAFCIPRPWRGLEHALYGYWTNFGVGKLDDLSPRQKQRLALFKTIMDGGRDVQPLAASDPETAHALGTPETDIVRGTVELGSLDPISPQKAYEYAALIRARGGTVTL